MSEVDEAVRSIGGTAATTLQLTMTLVEQHARRRAERLQRAAAESEQAREKARAALRAEADVQAARWAALSNTDADWAEGYATAVQWRELDPRAAAAAERIEESMRAAGVTVPDTSGVAAANRDSLAALKPRGEEDVRRDRRTRSERQEVGERAAEPSGALGVDVSVRAADEVELGWKSHPQPLNPTARGRRPATQDTPKAGRSASQHRRHPRGRGR